MLPTEDKETMSEVMNHIGEESRRLGAPINQDLVFPTLFLGSGSGGMSKREFFSALAMCGLMDPCSTLTVDQIAQMSIAQADALIAALKLLNSTPAQTPSGQAK